MTGMPPILWEPSQTRVRESGLMSFARRVRDSFEGPEVLPDQDYRVLHRWSIEKPDTFWEALWTWCDIVGTGGPGAGRTWEWNACSRSEGFGPTDRPVWFPDARLNFAENLLRPAETLPPDALALIGWDESGRRSATTFRELRRQVVAFAQGLEAHGIGPGDRVAGFLPNLPETVIAFLGCAAVGAIWSSCSPDFGVQAVVDRFGQIEPSLLVAAAGYRYKGKVFDLEGRISEIARALPSVTSVVLIPGQPGEAGGPAEPFHPQVEHRSVYTWQDWMTQSRSPDQPASSDGAFEFAQLPFDHPLVILYSSGTTGLPKCIVHGAGGTLLQHRKEHALHVDVRSQDRFFYFTTCGWMMWNWLVSGLAQGATLVLYDGAPSLPDEPDLLWRLAATEAVAVMGVSARYLALMEKSALSPGKTHQLESLRTLLSTGSPLAPSSFDWVYAQVKTDVHLASISGGTDIVSCFVGGIPTQPVRRGEIQGPGLGMAVEVRRAEDPEAPLGPAVVGEAGELICRAPFPSMPIAFWKDPDQARYRRAYFERQPGVWCHGDWAEETPSGGFRIHGRSDATLNPGGVRIGTAELYRQVEEIPEILEAIAVGWERAGGGPGDVDIALYVRLRENQELTPSLEDTIRKRIRTHASPHHVPRFIQAVPDLPRTVSGKLSEMAVREKIHGRPVRNVQALANPEALDHLLPPQPGAATELLREVVDYAGLFPPSSLSMEEAVAHFARYWNGPDRWALGRFVVPAARLDAFWSAAEPLIDKVERPRCWELSVLPGDNLVADLDAIERLEQASGHRICVPSIEVRVQRPEDIDQVAQEIRGRGAKPSEVWLELPLLSLPGATEPTDPAQLKKALLPFLDAIKASGMRAKVRTGGVEPSLFPTPHALLAFLTEVVRLGIRFKATAGLHHPLRGTYPLTYAEGAPRGLMFGYMNVLLATLALRTGLTGVAGELLVMESGEALTFLEDCLVWQDHRFPLEALSALRSEGMASFGSCSLREPVDELALVLRASSTTTPDS